MYETEVNDIVELIQTLPSEIAEKFRELGSRITGRTTLPWGEHCTECVWPSCYTTCDLYSPRADGACRQFIDGAIRIDIEGGLNPYILKIKFKQWAKLWTVGNLELGSTARARKQELFNIRVGAFSRTAPLPSALRRKVLQKISYYRRKSAEGKPPSAGAPDYFLLECFNPNDSLISATFTIRRRFRTDVAPFQTLLKLAPGYTRAKVEFREICEKIDLAHPFEVEIVPNDCDHKILYF